MSAPDRSTVGGEDQRKPLILAALLLAAFAINLDTTVVNVALPNLVTELGASNTQLQWIVDGYNLVFAALVLASGSLSDRVGRKGVLLAGLGVFGAASLAGGLTDSPGQLIAARCVMGIGAALIFPATLSLITNIFTERGERARAIGLWGANAGVAVALGPIIGGWLLESFSWNSIFFALVPVAALGAASVARFVPTSRDPEAAAADRLGVVLSTAAVGLLIFSIIEAPNQGWGSTVTLASFAIVAVLFALFVTWELRSAKPMLDVDLFRNPRFTAASASVTIAFFTLFGFIFLTTQFFQFFRHYSPLSTGLHLLPVAISVAVGSVVGTKLAVRFGTKIIVASGLAAIAVFYLWVSSASPSTAYPAIVVEMIIYGTGLGFTSAPATEAILGRGAEGQSRGRIGGQRRDPSSGRHARRRDPRQRLRLAVRESIRGVGAGAPAGPPPRYLAGVGGRGAAGRRRTCAGGAPGARGRRGGRGEGLVLPRLHRRLPGRRRGRRGRCGDGRGPAPGPTGRGARRRPIRSKENLMSLTRIDLRRGKPAPFRAQLRDVINQTMSEILEVPEEDRHEILTEHDAEDLSIAPSYLGMERSPEAILIQITVNQGYSTEEKQSFFWSLAKNLDEELLVRPDDVIVNLVEVAPDSWSFGAGRT